MRTIDTDDPEALVWSQRFLDAAKSGESSRQRSAEVWLLETLANGPVPAHAVIGWGAGKGYTEHQLRLAHLRLGNVTTHLQDGIRYWALLRPLQMPEKPV